MNITLSDKLAHVRNALLIGMSLDDALLFARLTPAEMLEVKENESLMNDLTRDSRQYEFTLLSKLNEVIDKQTHMGKEQAITWMLEHTNPRYSGKPQNEMPELHLHFGSDDTDVATFDTVSIRNTPTIQSEPKPNMESAISKENEDDPSQ